MLNVCERTMNTDTCTICRARGESDAMFAHRVDQRIPAMRTAMRERFPGRRVRVVLRYPADMNSVDVETSTLKDRHEP